MIKKRLFSLFLALTLCFSLLPTAAFAESAGNVSLEIDLSAYPYPFVTEEGGVINYTGTYLSGIDPDWNENFATITPGQVQSYQYSLDTYGSIDLQLVLDPDYPVEGWIVNGTEYRPDPSWQMGDDYAIIEHDESKNLSFAATTTSLKLYLGYFANEYATSGTWTIKPILPESAYTATVSTSDAAKGGVSARAAGDNIYEIRATANAGYSFDYWCADENNAYHTEEVYQLRENPYEVTLEKDEAYTAYFRGWKEATAAADPADYGTATAERVLDDKWRLTATPARDFYFDYWERDDGTRVETESFEVTLDRDTAYTAHFLSPQMTGIASVTAAAAPGSASGEPGTAALTAGSRVAVDVKFTATGNTFPHSQVEVYAGDEAAVKAGSATLLGRMEGKAELSEGKVNSDFTNNMIYADPMPAGIDKLTAVVWTDGCEKHYRTMDVTTAPAGEGLELNWLSTPLGYYTSADGFRGGPDLYGAAAFVDKQTGKPAVYAAGVGGVFELSYGDSVTAMTRMKGMEDLGYGGQNMSYVSYALAVGGPDVGDLTALCKVVTEQGTGAEAWGVTTYELRHYDTAAGAWKTVEGSAMPTNLRPGKEGAVNFALVMGADDVWTDKAHWDGHAWTAHGNAFTSFLKTGTDRAYGLTAAGAYSYGSGTWTRLDLPGRLVNAAPDGRLLVGLTGGGYAVWKDGAVTANYPAVGKSALGDIWTTGGSFVPSAAPTVHDVGFGGDGAVYALAQGRGRSYVLRGAESGWQLMDTAKAFDAGNTNEDVRSANVTRVAAVAEGVTLLFGGRGALYFQTAYYTITFNSNGGSAVNPITGQTWSPVSVPRPTKEGYVFAGWFYDDGAFKQPWSELVIPASNITLYAKWMEKGAVDPNDKYGEDRAKALAQLDQALDRMDPRDYTEENWKRVLQEYDNGLYAIQVAMPDPGSDDPEIVNKAIADTIYAALNAALNRMNAVPTQSVGSITVAVSVDADTIGLGYIVRPTLVTVPKYTRASEVVTDLLSQNGLRWTNTGTVNSSFYLAGIRPVDQHDAKPAGYLMNVKDFYFNESDKSDKLLSEFDYNQWSGWMYSIGDNGNDEYPSFPGVGCSEWRMIDGEVMRWQFTVYGYGADLNADNSAWGSSSLVPDAGNKSELTWAVAALRRDKSDAVLDKDEKFTAAIKVLEDPAATQAQIDSACEALTGGSKPVNPDDETSITTRPEVTPNATGEAKVELKAEDLADIIGRVREEGAGALVIEPAVDGTASKVTVELPKQSVADLAKDTDAALVVSTEIAKVRIPTAALAELAGKSGSTVSISAEALKDKNGSPNGQVKVEITVGGAAMEKLSGGITVTVPVKEPTAGTVMMIVTDEGSKILKKSSVSGKNVAALLDGSAIVIVKDNSKTFADVPEDYWGRDAVTFAASHELFQGIAADTFNPAGDMTRSMLVTVLWRLEDEAKADASTDFSDVDAAAWYGGAVQWASSNGIVTGTGNGFDPDGQITREQLATMLYRYAGAAGLSTSAKGDLDKFTDGGTASGWAGDALAWAVGSGLISGKGNATLDPSGTATRAEVATIFQRLVALMVE